VAEVLDRFEIGRKLREQDLDRDLAADEEVLRGIDRGHAALGELPDDAVTIAEKLPDEGFRLRRLTLRRLACPVGLNLADECPLYRRISGCARTRGAFIVKVYRWLFQ